MPAHESETTLTLAPAAGSGIGKIVAAELLALDIGKKVAATLDRGLTATRSHWVSEGQGKGYWEDEPDTRSQLQAAALILAHMEGEPVKRVIHQHMNVNGTVDLLSALQDSPELTELLQQQLTKAAKPRRGAKSVKAATPQEAH